MNRATTRRGAVVQSERSVENANIEYSDVGRPAASDSWPVSSVGRSVSVTVRPETGCARATANDPSSVSRLSSVAERRLHAGGSVALRRH